MPQLIPPPEVASLLVAFAPCFTGPSFDHFTQFVWVMMAGWGRRLTTAMCRSDPADKHHTDYARFLGRYRWQPAEVAQALLDLLLARLLTEAVGERLTVSLDGRPVPKSRGKMPGLGWHHCHNKGQCAGPFVHGHVWMQDALAARLGHETVSLPLRALFYRRKKDCRRGAPYQGKWRLALELLKGLRWPHGVRTVADGSFYVRGFARAIREAGHDLIVRLPKVAAVYRLPEHPAKRHGRPRTYGPKTSLGGAFSKARFERLEETFWGWHAALRIAEATLVPRVVGRPCKVVCVCLGRREPRYLLSTHLPLSAEEIVRLYAGRFSTEITFRELTQRCGFGDYQVRKGRAIGTHVQLSRVAGSLLCLLMLGDELPIDQFVWPAWRKPAVRLGLGQTQGFLPQIASQGPRRPERGKPRPPACRCPSGPACSGMKRVCPIGS